MALTDKLTAIADAIRAKAGTTDGLTLDGMVTAIEGISGGSEGNVLVTTGTITPTESVFSVEITHNLGSVPYVAVCYLEAQGDYIRSETVVSGTQAFSYSITGKQVAALYAVGSSAASNLTLKTMIANGMVYHANTSSFGVISSAKETTAILHPLELDSTVMFNAGSTYRWIMIAEEGM